VPSVSPIFRNAPAFLTADVDGDGTLRDIDDHVFLHRKWQALSGFPSLGVRRFTGVALVDLQHRIRHDPSLQARFALLYEGGAPSEIDARSWSTYWCAATAYTSSAFRACTDEGGLGFVTSRGLVAAFVLVLAVASAIAGWLSLRSRRARA
jgi:hypothetical protein